MWPRDEVADKDAIKRRIALARIADLLDKLFRTPESKSRLGRCIAPRGNRRLAERKLERQFQPRAIMGRRDGLEPLDAVTKMVNGLEIGRTAHSFGSRFEPIADRFFTELRARAMIREELGLGVRNRGELGFDDSDDPRMQRHALAAQEALIGRVLHQRMLKREDGIRRCAMLIDQLRLDQPIERGGAGASSSWFRTAQ